MKQPTDWTCYPTVVSYLTGIDYGTLLTVIGHDGSELKADGPLGRSAFCYHEMSLALFKLCWTITQIAAKLDKRTYADFDDLQTSLAKRCDRIAVIAKHDKILHCYAWKPKEGVILDPLTGNKIERINKPIMYFECLEKLC